MEGIIEADPFTTTQEDAEELNIDYSVLDIWSKLGRWKSSISGVPCELTENQKKLFWSVVFSYSLQQWTISQSYCDVQWKVDFTEHSAMTSSVVGLRS